MGQTVPLTFKVERSVANQIESEADQEDMSKSQYLREVVKGRHNTDDAIEELLEKVADYRDEISDLEETVHERDQEIAFLKEEVQERENKIKEQRSRINNVRELRASQERMADILDKHVENNSRLLKELAQDFNQVEDDVATMKKRQSVFIDEIRSVFDGVREAIKAHELSAKNSREYMKKVWHEFRRYHKQSYRAKLLRRFNLIDSRFALKEKKPEMTDNPQEEHPSDN